MRCKHGQRCLNKQQDGSKGAGKGPRQRGLYLSKDASQYPVCPHCAQTICDMRCAPRCKLARSPAHHALAAQAAADASGPLQDMAQPMGMPAEAYMAGALQQAGQHASLIAWGPPLGQGLVGAASAALGLDVAAMPDAHQAPHDAAENRGSGLSKHGSSSQDSDAAASQGAQPQNSSGRAAMAAPQGAAAPGQQQVLQLSPRLAAATAAANAAAAATSAVAWAAVNAVVNPAPAAPRAVHAVLARPPQPGTALPSVQDMFQQALQQQLGPGPSWPAGDMPPLMLDAAQAAGPSGGLDAAASQQGHPGAAPSPGRNSFPGQSPVSPLVDQATAIVLQLLHQPFLLPRPPAIGPLVPDPQMLAALGSAGAMGAMPRAQATMAMSAPSPYVHSLPHIPLPAATAPSALQVAGHRQHQQDSWNDYMQAYAVTWPQLLPAGPPAAAPANDEVTAAAAAGVPLAVPAPSAESARAAAAASSAALEEPSGSAGAQSGSCSGGMSQQQAHQSSGQGRHRVVQRSQSGENEEQGDAPVPAPTLSVRSEEGEAPGSDQPAPKRPRVGGGSS
mmetsp:Transcript_4760/g.11696  ORF Transcript_4760/g.11696 Transcript_4760/m.11696 type:complete len:561 (-) Transcript_4760:213-1895(-)